MPNASKRDPNQIVGLRAAFNSPPFSLVGKVLAYIDEPCYLVADEHSGENQVVLAEFFHGVDKPVGRCPRHALTYCEECGWV
jgi:hypothetical protein